MRLGHLIKVRAAELTPLANAPKIEKLQEMPG